MRKDTEQAGESASPAGSAALKFVLCSLAGIFLFFVQISVGGSRTIPVDYLIAGLKSLLNGVYTYLLLLLSALALFFRVYKRSLGKNLTNWILFLQAAAGFLFCLAVALGVGPEEFLSVGRSAINATGNIICAVFVASLFIPLLTEYGLVDAAGVICRPLMRRLFLTPGSSAVIGVSAFLGNYSLGHVMARQMYDEGKYTEKETVIVAMGFSTCSIGLMINLANYMDLMPYWTAYVGCILVITFVTTAVTARLFPISRKKNTYREGVTPKEETAVSGNLLKNAWAAGVSQAGETSGFFSAILHTLARVFPVICEITATSIFVIVCGLLAARYTDLFYWLGVYVRPILSLAGDSAEALHCAVSAVGASIFEPVIAGILCDGQDISLTLRWVAAVVPYTSVVFFAGFIPSACSAGIPCRIWEMVLLWIERTLIGAALALLAAVLLF